MKSHARMKLFLKALKIAVGSVLAIVIAELLGLSYATSAGIITLLTIQDTWKDTVQLTSDRLMSYLMCIILIFACFHIGRAGWGGFTFYILLMVVICYLAGFMHNRNAPEEAMWKLQNIFDQMEKEALPRTREEFENRAILFHVLMDLEEFLLVKQRFLENTERETGV